MQFFFSIRLGVLLLPLYTLFTFADRYLCTRMAGTAYCPAGGGNRISGVANEATSDGGRKGGALALLDYKYPTDNPALLLLLHLRVLAMYLKRSSKPKRNLLDLVLNIPPPYEKARRQRENEESELTKAKMNRAAEELEEEIRSAALLQQVMAKEGRAMVRRRRAYSDATEVPSDGETTSSTRDDTETEEEMENDGMVTAETMVETYPTEIKCGETSFWSVKLFHPRPGVFFHLV